MKDVIEKVSSFEPSDCDYWEKELKAIECMKLYTDSTTCTFLFEQFQILLTKKHGRRYNKHVLIFAAELFVISPAAYRMIKRSQILMLPDEKVKEIIE